MKEGDLSQIYLDSHPKNSPRPESLEHLFYDKYSNKIDRSPLNVDDTFF